MTVMPYNPGQLLLVDYPFTDLTAAKRRPVLVVSSRGFNLGGDFVVVPLSSQIRPDDRYGFPIESRDDYFATTKLKKDSTVKWTKPLTINTRVVCAKLGTIPDGILHKIQDKVKTLFGD
jgi:mRNA interferase MazF